jgi:GDP-4-dehydro-6-deoxy-D-mannose reductase
VVPGIAKKIRAAAPGSKIETGNLDALRDFTDVRDVVRAYRLILEKKPDEKIFVIGSGRATLIKDIFRFFAEISGKNITSYVSESLRREESSGAILADAGLARRILGWVPEITLHQSLRDVWHEQT